jgi:hypothetical protein
MKPLVDEEPHLDRQLNRSERSKLRVGIYSVRCLLFLMGKTEIFPSNVVILEKK